MSDPIELQARACAARVPANVGLDPVTVITIMTTVLPLLMNCFQRHDEPSPAAMRDNIKEQHERAPQVLRRRTARRIRGEAEQPMTRDQSYALADAVIAEAVQSADDTLPALANACGLEYHVRNPL